MNSVTYIVKVPAIGTPSIEPFTPKDSYAQLVAAIGGGYLEAAPIPRLINSKCRYAIDCFVDEEGVLKSLPLNLCASLATYLHLYGDAVFAAHAPQGETVGLSKTDADTLLALLNAHSLAQKKTA